MAKKRLLIQVQLSNYDLNGKFIIESDSNWGIWAWRSREMLKLNPELEIDLLIPQLSQIKTSPWDFCPEIFESGRLHLIEHHTLPNAPATRYDFDMNAYRNELNLSMNPKYDAVFINDPALLPNFKALFFLYGKYVPKFFLQIHFVDHPVWSGRAKFPAEVSLWDRQVEAMRKADHNFWMCQPTADVVTRDMYEDYRDKTVNDMLLHCSIWDDGYSQTETMRDPDMRKVRFTPKEYYDKVAGRMVIFAPNRVGDGKRTSDYTHIGEFLFEKIPELYKRRQDFVVIAGNPSQKILNSELEERVGKYGYISLVPDGFNRDEYRWVGRHGHIGVSLYDTEHHGGVASRECVEMGMLPLWTDCNEYHHMAEAGEYKIGLCKPDRSDLVDRLDDLLTFIKTDRGLQDPNVRTVNLTHHILREAIRNRCAFERTTPEAMKTMGLL
jgi:hypothetical protein